MRTAIHVKPILILGALVAVLALGDASASAVEPWWHLTSSSRPSYLAPEGEGTVVATVVNAGDQVVNGEKSPVTIVDTLPAGLEAVKPKGPSEPAAIVAAKWFGNSFTALSCVEATLTCTLEGSLAPYQQLEVRIRVKVKEGAHSGELNRVSVSGGGAPPATLERPIVVSEASTPFGVDDFELRAEEEGGALATQAGSHPFQVTGTYVFNQGEEKTSKSGKPIVFPAGLPKDIDTLLPPGLIGDPTPLPVCTASEFAHMQSVGDSPGRNPEENECPAQTAVGMAAVTIEEPGLIGYTAITVPVFNLEPAFGEPARFGFAVPVAGSTITLDTALRSGAGEDYGITVSSLNTTEQVGTLSAQVTFWGVPGDPRHDSSRGWACLWESEGKTHAPCIPSGEKQPPAFLTMPTSCGGPLSARAHVNSWAEPGNLQTFLPPEPLQSLDGCNQLPFAPLISAQPSTDRASAPTGLDFNLDFHDEGLTASEGIAQSQLNKTVVQLPEGLTVNPSAGVGLAGCTPADYARETVGSAPGAGCPNSSKLGTVEIETPLLPEKIHGSIFIAQPYENPSKSLIALYIVAKNPEAGILIKLAGRVEPNPVTGQLTTTFEDNPPLSFSHFNFHFREGQQAPLISPPTCGTYTTDALLSPWSQPLSTLTDTSSFQIDKGFDGGACPAGGAPPFGPGIEAGLLNNNAGAFSPFYLRLSRNDAEQEIAGFSTNLPPGLTGILTGIPFCPEADIALSRTKTSAQEEASPSCPASSLIGHTFAGAGVGSVLAYTPGKLYLAGPYNGDPFSVVDISSTQVGPFDLGTVVIRFGLHIDPVTAQVSVDPIASEGIPTILDGIVTHVRDIRVHVDRPSFMVNPTSCDPMSISSTLKSPGGAASTASSRFQSTNCLNLGFKPSFKVSTSGKTSRKLGASLHVRLAYPKAPFGSQANIRYVRVALPRQLPSNLKTIQQACPDHVFEADPAGCPAASRIGTATTTTPLLPVPLTGPVYFVSHAAREFPDLVAILQGYGVTIDLRGRTFIAKSGQTTTTFETVPDAPVGVFEMDLPQGPFSALAAPNGVCKVTTTKIVKQKVTVRGKNGRKRTVTRKVRKTVPAPLVMPTRMIAQNGAVFTQETKIKTVGCPKAKGKAKKMSKKGKHKK